MPRRMKRRSSEDHAVVSDSTTAARGLAVNRKERVAKSSLR
jgi:hypothetical protein